MSQTGKYHASQFFGDLDSSTEMPLDEGHCYEIKNFSLNPTTERIRLTNNRYYINLNNFSVILKIDPILKSNFYCFPNFIHVFCGLAHLKFSIGMFYILSNLF